ncbi:uncharacterized protein LOC123274989 [Cotesia glomerata]|uniref:Uncharacterized protein n=1 Tax=Cotesia glomerata TaxID=32391 RepID=A0AAV7J9S1_COTGL|nr:uncharacterized protein LOC123274989 [Cotesia glomerata]KAH0568873.1 hypothetical protein KQX54_021569 [Cotesia glomerata]
MIAILQLLLFSELLSISQIDVYCLEEAVDVQPMPSPLLNSAQSQKSLDSDGRRYFENRNDFPGFAAQAITEETDVFNGQLNTNVNMNSNTRVPWIKQKGRNKLRRRRGGFRKRRLMNDAKRKQGLKQMVQVVVPRSALSQSSVTFDTNAVKDNGRRTKTKCPDSSEEEDLDTDSPNECNCNIGSKILRQIRQLRYQLDVMENLVYDNLSFDDES